MVDAKGTFQTTYKMTKYQQALVRRELKSLLSVPIFNHLEFLSERANIENPLIGVLNFDSDADLLKSFAKQAVQQEAVECAKTLSRFLLTAD